MGFFYKKNRILEEMVLSYFDAISEYNDKNFDGKLSIILLGSLSRGEGSFIEENGNIKVLSDIEYFTVYPEGFSQFKEYTDFCQNKADEIFGKDNSSLFYIDNTFVKRESLKNMERKLITFDAKKMGKNVVGKNGVELLPDIDINNINLRDIYEVLTHRAFSVLYYGLPLKEEGKLSEYRYSLAKNSLDLMTVMLVSKGILESGFIKRLEIINTLPIDEEIKNYFSYCLSLKLSTESEFFFEIDKMEEIFIFLLKQLNREFKVPFKNNITNFRYVFKRNMGKVKRMIKYKHLPSLRHLDNLISSFDKKEKITNKIIKDNLVLHGYPIK